MTQKTPEEKAENLKRKNKALFKILIAVVALLYLASCAKIIGS